MGLECGIRFRLGPGGGGELFLEELAALASPIGKLKRRSISIAAMFFFGGGVESSSRKSSPPHPRIRGGNCSPPTPTSQLAAPRPCPKWELLAALEPESLIFQIWMISSPVKPFEKWMAEQ